MLAVAEHEDIQSELIPRIATGFCSGVARTGGTCGAVSGGIMAISLITGRNLPGDPRDRCYAATRKFLDRFSAQFGAINCQELTGVHLGTPEGQVAFREKEQIRHCTDYVGEAARIVVDIINDQQV